MVTRRTWATVLVALLAGAATATASLAASVPLQAGERHITSSGISTALASLEIQIEPVTLLLRNANSMGEELVVTIGRDGSTDAATAELLAQMFRCRRSGRTRHMDPGVLALLAEIGARWPGHAVEFVSAYRSPPYGVPHSRHFKGKAIDLRVAGVPLSEVRDTLWGQRRGIGVGFYMEQKFLHVDSRLPSEDSAWTSRHEGSAYRYNPGWSVSARARHPEQAQTAPAELAALVAAQSGWRPLVRMILARLAG
jgi:uncharacterized protein YcbK (DUF882 family)